MNLGINLAGAAYNLFPSTASADYYAAKGFTLIRLPIKWEMIQQKLGGPLDTVELTKIKAFIEHAATLGMEVILDIHNQGAYNGKLIGTPQVPISSFADVWSKLAGELADMPNVTYGLMNEPQQKTAAEWLPAVNAAIDAIRDAGADQKILVPGVLWTGGWTWTTTSDNAKVIGAPGAVVDPLNNYAFEIHQYLDDTSGTRDWVVSETIGVERLQAVTEWARATGSQLYLGEFGVAANEMSLKALTNMMDFLAANQDVWQGMAYWAGGPSWNDYMYSVEPELGLLDAAQMDVLEQYTDTRTVFTNLDGGGTRVDTIPTGHNSPSITDVFDANDNLVSRTLFNSDGQLDRVLVAGADGSYTVTDYLVPGKGLPTTVSTYNGEYSLVAKAVFNANGSHDVDYFDHGSPVRTREEHYAENGQLKQTVAHEAGGHVVSNYTSGKIATVETYSQNWLLQGRDTYNTNGIKASSQVDRADGTHVVEQFNVATGLLSGRVEYSSKWAVTLRAEFDPQGHLALIVKPLPDGTRVLEHYTSGKAGFAYAETLTSDYKLISKTTAQQDGNFVQDIYTAPGSARLASRDVYDADWSLQTRTTFDGNGKVASIQHELENGQHRTETFTATNQGHPSSIVTYDVAWNVVDRSAYDASGRLTQFIQVNASNGNLTIDNYVSGTTRLASVETYTAGYKTLLDRTKYDADGHITSIQTDHANGTHTVVNYAPSNQQHPSGEVVYDVAWNVVNRSVYDASGHLTAFIKVNATNGNITAENYLPGTTKLTSVETYTAGWKTLLDRTKFDAQGNITSIQTDHANGTHTVVNYSPGNQQHPSGEVVYDIAWNVVNRSVYDAGGHLAQYIQVNAGAGTVTLQTYVSGTTKLASLETFTPGWKVLLDRTTYDAQGNINMVQVNNADGSKTIATYDIPGSAYATKLVAYDNTGHVTHVSYPAEDILFATNDDSFQFAANFDSGNLDVASSHTSPYLTQDDPHAPAHVSYDLLT